GSGGGSGGGVIHATASEAVLTAMVAARARASVGAPVGAEFTAYASSQAHSSVVKAGMVAGLGREGVRAVPVDASLAMDPAALSRMIDDDQRAGRRPFFVCATVGTTSTGAVDPLGPIGEVCARHRTWLHVDAAYAGAACVCPEFRAMISGVEQADSFNFNPHKWLLTNFDCSLFWTRDRAALVDALSITPAYLRNAASDAGAVIDYRDWQIPLGRRFRALKLWFVLRHYGAEGLRAHIRESVRLAEVFEALVRADARFEVPVPRSLSLVCFRYRGPEGDAGDEANRALVKALNDSGAMLITPTVVPVGPGAVDRVVLRMAIGGPFTREEHVRAAWGRIQEAAAAAVRTS
ncbi:MAG TPA: aspartate aminotransferase family protein, partial [Phycisphaerales bacterium]|nr:aspartate aminotransferase family protein [Phycisphaerales bacterium]